MHYLETDGPGERGTLDTLLHLSIDVYTSNMGDLGLPASGSGPIPHMAAVKGQRGGAHPAESENDGTVDRRDKKKVRYRMYRAAAHQVCSFFALGGLMLDL